MIDQYMLTTTDNPYSPVTDYDEWLTWDMQYYNSMGLLARVVMTSSDLSDELQMIDIQQGIEEIVRENVSGVHTRVLASPGTVSQDFVDDGTLEEDRAA